MNKSVCTEIYLCSMQLNEHANPRPILSGSFAYAHFQLQKQTNI